MKKWKCTVCGFIYTGDAPPERCPVCGAPRSKFIDVSEPEAPAAAPTPAAAADAQPDAVPENPESELPAVPAESSAPDPQTPFKGSRYHSLFQMMTKYHGHPVSVHIPNGLLPVSVLFIILSALFSFKGMASAATYNYAIVALSMPLVLFSGWVDCQNRFNGAVTDVFFVKIACGVIVTVTSWLLFVWLLVNPEVVATPQASRVAFFMINLIMLGAAGTAGWFGGKLVFRD